MGKPIVAVVGRPNVGKSTLFNYLAGSRISIVDDTPGVTRDRVYAEAEWRGRTFALVDTGGIETQTDDAMLRQMRSQAEIAIETADVILFMVDVQSGLTAADQDVGTLLRKSGKPIVVCVNKADRPGPMAPDAYEFYNLGLGEIFPVSSVHGLGTGDLLDAIFEHFPPAGEHDEDDDVIRVAVIGKPNAGKSSLVNRMLGEERTIVSEVPGTTRDAIDSPLSNQYGRYVLVDTAGLRKKSRIDDDIERYSMIRALAAIEKADVCIVLIDAQDGVTEQDTKIAGYAHNSGKACILVVNKWDLVDKETGTLEHYEKSIREGLVFLQYAPVLFISAKSGQRVPKLFELINHVYAQACLRLSTGMLNDLLAEAMAMSPPPNDKGKRLRIYYATQVGVKPPEFVFFLNDKELMHFSYERYLENQFRKCFGFEGTPIRFILRERERENK
jgi:GTPase